jgi:GNAT superfamily N-acetyltransferase
MEGVRRAVASDIADVVRLAEEARQSTRTQRGGDLWLRENGRSSLPSEVATGLLADPTYEIAVGTIDDAEVGYVIARGEPPVAMIEELYVEPEAREVGVGEALVDHVLAWARQRGCTGIDGFALPGDRATKNLFERFGLTARAIIVHKALGDE